MSYSYRAHKMDQDCCKMALRMDASVVRSLVLFVFLFICVIFCSPPLVTFTREELLNIGLSAGKILLKF